MNGWPAKPEQIPTGLFGASLKWNTHVQRHSEQHQCANIFTLRCHRYPIRYRIGDPMKYEYFETHCFCKICAHRLKHRTASCRTCALMHAEVHLIFRHAEVLSELVQSYMGSGPNPVHKNRPKADSAEASKTNPGRETLWKTKRP